MPKWTEDVRPNWDLNLQGEATLGYMIIPIILQLPFFLKASSDKHIQYLIVRL